MTDTRKACLEPVSWLYVDPYWNARQGLLDGQGKKVIGAVVGRVHPAADEEKGKYWWVAAPWCGGSKGEESGYAQTLEEAQDAVEAVAEKSPEYRVGNGQKNFTNTEALVCWVKALQTDNIGLPKMSVMEAGTDGRVEVDLYNDDPTHLVDGTWTEAVVTPRGQDDKS